ncbi:nuclear transport factor 2 family protein [Geothrix sp. 21YS21S-4]|uniref:nuclear transport factor 2 family protein n=1 Tax=Geothrix sp. 21YS21S-4 TaxID=3068889 RepID=UPI0027BA27D8|nr:nuclear transport factor 2 family protein [Geothrix sp. 21YS21S-4]
MRPLLSCLLVPALSIAASAQVVGPEAVVQRQIEAFNAHDLEAFLAVFGEKVEATDLPGSQVVPQGKSRLRELYAERLRRNPQLHASVLERMVSGNFVIQRERISGRTDKPDLEAVVIYQIEDNAIRRMWTLG